MTLNPGSGALQAAGPGQPVREISSDGGAWKIAILLALFMLINSADKIVLGLVAVPIMDERNLTPEQFGNIASSFFWLSALGGIAGGFLANRFSSKILILGMMLVWSACQLPILGSASIGTIVVCRMVLGVSQGPAWPVAVHAICKRFPDDDRNLPIAVLAQGSSIGLILAGIFIPLVTAAWGWRANLLVLATIGSVWALIWSRIDNERTLDRAAAASPVAAPAIPYRHLLLDRSVLGCIVTNFVGYWSLALGLTWFAAYFQRGLGYDGIASGWLYSLVILLTVPFGVGLAWWSQWLLRRGISSKAARARFLSFFLALAGALFAAFYLNLPGDWTRIALLAAGLGCTTIVYSLSPGILAEVIPPSQRGAMLAIHNSIASLAGIGAPFVTGVLIQGLSGTRGYEIGFALSGGLMMAGGILGMWMIDPARSVRSLRRAMPVIRGAVVE